jgi:serine/threonine-protein kinase
MEPASRAPEAPPPSALQPGQELLGRYTLLSQLGEGGMGVVLSAYDAKLDRRVALKLMGSRAASQQREAEQLRLMREAQAMARLSHPHVVTVYDTGRLEDGRVFVAMEMVEGTTLRHWCREPGRTWREVLEVYVAAGRGLAAAHAVGLVHRDFKPDNVLVGKDGRVRVTDFGLARSDTALEEAPSAPVPVRHPALLDTPLTQPGMVPGTPKYMAPELLKDQPATARTDLYAFCVALYEALYHQPPFAPHDRSGHARTPRPRDAAPPPHGSGVPSWVARPVLQGLSYQASDRPASMEALLAALSRSPTHLWLRALAGAAAMVVVATVATAAYLRASEVSQRCQAGPQRLAGLWDEPARQRVQQSFTATGQPYAAEAAQGVLRSLDAYASGWGRMSQESCEATHVRGVQPEPVLTLRMACLERHRQQFAGVVEALSQANDAMVMQASEALAALTPIEECADVEALQAQVSEPVAPEERQTVETLRRELARVCTLSVDEGRSQEAVQTFDAAVAQARTLKSPSMLMEALLMRCRHGHPFDPRAAIQACGETVWLAQAQRQDRIAVEASTRLLSYQLGLDAPELVDFWRDYATSALARVRGDALLEARLQHTLSRLLSMRGQGPRAREARQRALELTHAALERIQGDRLQELNLLEDLSNYYQDDHQYAPSLRFQQRYTQLLAQVFGPNHPRVFLANVRQARLLALSGQMPQAVSLMEDTVFRAGQVLPPRHSTRTTLLTSLTYRQSAVGLLPQAERTLTLLREHLEATTPAVSHPRFSWLVLASELALKRGQYAQALRYAQQALEQCGGLNLRQTLREAWAMSHAARALVKLGRPREAQVLLEQAARRIERSAGAESLEVVSHHQDRALLREAQGDHAQALRLRQSALERMQKIEGEQGSWLEREPMRLDVAHSLLGLGRAAEALEGTQQPVAVLREGLGDQAPKVLQGWRLQGAALLRLGRAAEAIPPLEQAVRGGASSGIDPNDQALSRLLLARALREAGRPPGLAAEQVKRAQEDYARTAWPHRALHTRLLRWAARR